MKRSRHISPRVDARRHPGVFHPRVEQLETRNAPGEVLSLSALSLWGTGLDLFSEDATRQRDQDHESTLARLSLLSTVASQTALPVRAVTEGEAGFAPLDVGVAAPAVVADGRLGDFDARALTDAAEFATSFGTFDGESVPAAADRGDGLDQRWSPQLEALLNQSLGATGTETSRIRTDDPSYATGRRGNNLAALQVYAGIQPTGLGGVQNGPNGLTILMSGDTNRDAIIDEADFDGRNAWTRDRGAIYAVNFDDDNGDRLPDAVDWNDQGRPFNENKFIEDDNDLLDQAPLVIYAFGAGLSDSMRVYLRAGSQEDAQSIHVFPFYAAGYEAILGGIGNRATGGAAEPIEADITDWISRDSAALFGVEGLVFRETNTAAAQAHRHFDGYIDLTLEVRDGASVVGSDTIRMKVAPWMMSHHMEASVEAYVGDFGATNGCYRRTNFNATCDAAQGYVGLNHSGQLEEVTAAQGQGTQWLQDHGEFGFTGFPGGPKTWVFFRLPYFRGGPAQPNWPKTRVLRPDVGTFQIGINHGAGSGDYGGNLEVTHPTGTNILGQIALGSIGSTALFTFLQSQEVQTPFRINTGWLVVGHADETFMFTQNYGEVVVASPRKAYELMNAIPVADRGRAVFFAKGANPVSGTATQLGTTTRIYTGMNHTTGTQWQWVRIYDSSATGSNAAGQIARISARGNGFLDVSRVYNSTTTIIGAAGGNNHMEWATRRDIPNQATWYNIPRQGDRFVLIQDTQQWASNLNNAPSAITVHEVLADATFRNFSLTNVQNTINGQMTQLETATGGPGSLSFVEVPVLFFGRASGTTVASRSAVAMTPGLANVIPLNTELYFPRQYGFRNAAGQDVFETYTQGLMPNALFVDDWNLYHRLLGEVHCGIVARADHWFPDWYYYA